MVEPEDVGSEDRSGEVDSVVDSHEERHGEPRSSEESAPTPEAAPAAPGEATRGGTTPDGGAVNPPPTPQRGEDVPVGTGAQDVGGAPPPPPEVTNPPGSGESSDQ